MQKCHCYYFDHLLTRIKNVVAPPAKVHGIAVFWLILLIVGDAAAQPLTLLVSRSPFSLPVYVAAERGFFATENLEVKLLDCSSGQRCLQRLLAGEADVATAGDVPLTLAGFESDDYAIIATIATSGEDLKLIVDARSGIRKPGDLSGRRVGVVIGAASQYFLEVYLLQAGVDPKKVHTVGLQPEDMQAALQARRIDAAAVWEPHAWRIARNLGQHAVRLPVASGYFQSFNLVSHRRLVGTRDDALVKLLRAIERSQRSIQNEPSSAKAILRERLDLDQGFVDHVWSGLAYRLSLEQSLIAAMEGEARWARREGHVTAQRTPNYLKLMHTLPMKIVKPEALGIR